MKTIVIYQSKTGFVKKYVQWIAEELSADVFEVSKVDINWLADYDTVVYGGSLHAVGINGVKFITKNMDRLKDKRLVAFASGASPSNAKVIKAVMNNNFTLNQQKQIAFFYLRGGFNYEKLPPFDKVLMTLLRWKIKIKKLLKKDLIPDEIGMLAFFDKPVDFTRKEYICEIVDYIKS